MEVKVMVVGKIGMYGMLNYVRVVLSISQDTVNEYIHIGFVCIGVIRR